MYAERESVVPILKRRNAGLNTVTAMEQDSEKKDHLAFLLLKKVWVYAITGYKNSASKNVGKKWQFSLDGKERKNEKY